MKKAHIISIVLTLAIVGLTLSQSTTLINSGIFARDEGSGYVADGARQLPSSGPASLYEELSQPTAFQADCVAPPTSMVSWWPGDGNANDIQDGNNGILTGGATATGTGKVGQAFSLNGTTSYVNFGNPANLGITGALSIEAWINPSVSPAQGNAFAIVSNFTNDTGSYSFTIQPRPGFPPQLSSVLRRANGTTPNISGGGNIFANVPLNTWSHVATTWDPMTGRLSIFVNGVQVNTTTVFIGPTGATLAPGAAVAIGRVNSSGAGGNYFNGLIDEVSIYNTTLTATQIQAIFNAGALGKCKPAPEPCAFGIAPSFQAFKQQGGTGTVTVFQSSSGPPTCEWRAIAPAEPDSFVTVSNGSGMGSGFFNVTVAANSSNRGRSATINLFAIDNSTGGQSFTVLQPLASGGPCTYMLSPGDQTVSSSGGERTVLIIPTPATCTWTASPEASWIDFPPGGSPQAPAEV